MKLDFKNISHIYKNIVLNDKEKIVMINVTENDGAKWSHNECNFNIYCLDKENNIIWQIKELGSKPVSIFGETDSFCYLTKNAQGEIIADRFSGFTYKIDPKTGVAKRTGFHK